MSATGRLRSHPARPRGRCDAGEHGGVLLLVATLLPVLLSFTGAAVDVRNGYVVRSMLQHSLDDGVLSAQRWSAQTDDTSGAAPGGIEQGAIAEALVVARQELASEGLSRATVTTAMPSGGRLTMTAETPVPTFFLGALGIRSWTVVARADIALWSGRTIAPTAGAPIGSEVNGPAPAFFTGWGAGSAGALPPARSAGGDRGTAPGTASTPAGPSTQSDASAGIGAVDAPAACNCDAIVAGDAASAAAALDRMGVTPADPGPYAGDFTAGLGLGEMQSQQQADAGASAASDGNPGDGGGDSSGAGSDDGSGDGGAW
ncbi:MAG TPA: pilus assembly protein TadG-related protein [bacterium]|nr:pilus assembly protein TadG-related protein [bacterium]